MFTLPFNALAVVVALAVSAWLAFQFIQGLRTGSARAAGFRFSRDARPSEFWLILAVQLFVILLLLVAAALEVVSIA